MCWRLQTGEIKKIQVNWFNLQNKHGIIWVETIIWWFDRRFNVNVHSAQSHQQHWKRQLFKF